MTKINAIRVISPTLCDYCTSGKPHHSNVSLTEINSNSTSWELKGSGELNGITMRCPKCAVMYQAVVRMIPINTSVLSCPTCGESDSLELKVDRINHTSTLNDVGDISFEFHAELTCSQCHGKKSISEKFWDAIGISEIEVTLSGVKIKRA